ncbi:MAG: hypothetical protein ACXVFC_03915 [Gaiellaceae bacterium]
MTEGDLYRIEDDVDEGWLERWLETGIETIEAYLSKHAAFVDYLEAAEQS